MEKGTFVGFTAKGQRKIGLVEGPDGKTNLSVKDASGRTSSVHPREVYFSSADYRAEFKNFLPNQFSGFQDRAMALKDQIRLEEVWELLKDEKTSTNLTEIGSLVFSHMGPEETYALWEVLEQDKVYFKAKHQDWELRTPDQVEEALRQIKLQEARHQAAEGFRLRLEAALREGAQSWEPEDLRKLEALKKFALWDEEAPEKTSAHEILTLMGRNKTAPEALQVLQALKLWSKHENLDLQRNQIPVSFPSEIQTAAQKLIENPPSPQPATDARDQVVYTVDEATTLEIDDGFAITEDSQGQKHLWIHIADPTRWFTWDSPLDREARQRGTSLYLPDLRVTMLPEVLAQGPMSLRPGIETTALSFCITLAATGAVETYTIHRSLIKPSHRLTYAQADEILKSDQNPDWKLLDEWTRRRTAWRQSQGSIEINLPETDLTVDLDKDEISLGIFPEYRSRDIVSEMMVLASEVAGDFCHKNQIPVAYRTQTLNSPIEKEALDQIPPGPLREFAKISQMSRSSFSLERGPHQGLGLQSYVQVTSPIRRYLDLVAHYQILGFLLQGKPLLSEDDFLILVKAQEDLQIQSSRMERSRQRYWTLEYFARQDKNTLFKGNVLEISRRDDQMAQVLMEGTGLRLQVKIQQTPVPGQEIQFKVTAVDPRKDLLNLQQK